MHFSLSSLLFASTLLTSSLAAPASAPLPKRDISSDFSIFVKSTNPSLHGRLLQTYHVGAGLNLVTLTTTNTGFVGHLNGTAQEFTDRQTSYLVAAGPNGEYFEGLNIGDRDEGTRLAPLTLNAGDEGFRAFYVQDYPRSQDDLFQLNLDPAYYQGFYVCTRALPYGSAEQLFVLLEGPTPTDCTNVQLVVAAPAPASSA
ncbi:hypothetical protein MMC24_005728 [Lignoscripta atroalba]|nr:hypothetical protein [Lignoscripta atroalba]